MTFDHFSGNQPSSHMIKPIGGLESQGLATSQYLSEETAQLAVRKIFTELCRWLAYPMNFT